MPGPTPAGTVFEARSVYKGKVYTARTATWMGTVHATAAPRLTGRPGTERSWWRMREPGPGLGGAAGLQAPEVRLLCRPVAKL